MKLQIRVLVLLTWSDQCRRSDVHGGEESNEVVIFIAYTVVVATRIIAQSRVITSRN